MKDYLID